MRLQGALFLLPCLLHPSIAYTTLSDASLRSLPDPGQDFDIKNGALLAPILRTRVPGTSGSQAVLAHFIDFFNSTLPEWKVSIQTSSQVTPASNGKEVPFTNLIATRDPPWTTGEGDVGRLALVAHYDSKSTPDGFIGATDSAAPCAMLLHTARSLESALAKKWATMAAAGHSSEDLEDHKGLQIILLDGEEAFHTWTHEDSLYGARSLAAEWEQTTFSAWSNYESPLGAIDLFVLLDLLGAKDPRVPSYFKTTHWAYQRMANVEERLRIQQRFKTSPNHASQNTHAIEQPFLNEGAKKETDRWWGGRVEDDHLPFMARGVDVLHLIPSPFPAVWHTINDDGEHLDMDTVEDWAMLTTAFAAEWMDLEGYLVEPSSQAKRSLAAERTELNERGTEGCCWKSDVDEEPDADVATHTLQPITDSAQPALIARSEPIIERAIESIIAKLESINQPRGCCWLEAEGDDAIPDHEAATPDSGSTSANDATVEERGCCWLDVEESDASEPEPVDSTEKRETDFDPAFSDSAFEERGCCWLDATEIQPEPEPATEETPELTLDERGCCWLDAEESDTSTDFTSDPGPASEKRDAKFDSAFDERGCCWLDAEDSDRESNSESEPEATLEKREADLESAFDERGCCWLDAEDHSDDRSDAAPESEPVAEKREAFEVTSIASESSSNLELRNADSDNTNGCCWGIRDLHEEPTTEALIARKPEPEPAPEPQPGTEGTEGCCWLNARDPTSSFTTIYGKPAPTAISS